MYVHEQDIYMGDVGTVNFLHSTRDCIVYTTASCKLVSYWFSLPSSTLPMHQSESSYPLGSYLLFSRSFLDVDSLN